MSDSEPISLPEFNKTKEGTPAQPAARKPSAKKPKPQQRKPSRHDGTWNLLSALLLAGTFFVASFYVLIYTRPELLADNTPLSFLIAHTPTPLEITFAPQSTPTFTPELPTPEISTPESTPEDLNTPTATIQAVEATPLDPNATPDQGTPAVNSFYAFDIQGEVNAIDGTVIDQNHGCEWMGVAGRVQAADGSPATGIQVHLVGYINGRNRDLLTLSGTGQAFGPGGYEFTLTNHPVRSTDAAWIQLVEQNGLPLSPRIRFNTYDDCSRNLIVINFIQVR